MQIFCKRNAGNSKVNRFLVLNGIFSETAYVFTRGICGWQVAGLEDGGRGRGRGWCIGDGGRVHRGLGERGGVRRGKFTKTNP